MTVSGRASSGAAFSAALPKPELRGEVVAQPRQGAGPDQAGHVARVAPERGVEGPLRA